jgi:hypothetical protein
MDNYFKECPAMMSDGRIFTDYRTAVRREETNKYMNRIVRDDDYRMFLQNNADKIMDNIWDYNKKKYSCWQNECVHNYPTRVYPPWQKEERLAYDQLALPKSQRKVYFNCKKMDDYRLK